MSRCSLDAWLVTYNSESCHSHYSAKLYMQLYAIIRDTLSQTSVFLEIFHKASSEEERVELLPRYCLVTTMSRLSKEKYVSDSLHYIE